MVSEAAVQEELTKALRVAERFGHGAAEEWLACRVAIDAGDYGVASEAYDRFVAWVALSSEAAPA